MLILLKVLSVAQNSILEKKHRIQHTLKNYIVRFPVFIVFCLLNNMRSAFSVGKDKHVMLQLMLLGKIQPGESLDILMKLFLIHVRKTDFITVPTPMEGRVIPIIYIRENTINMAVLLNHDLFTLKNL